jgi:peptidoglycan-associated lipoprotein
MRVVYFLPLLTVFGCAHQQTETASAPPPSPTTETASTPPPSPTTEVAATEKTTCPSVRVHFATDSAVLDDAEKSALDLAANCLRTNERMRISIAGHADDRGSEEYNEALGQQRADAVANYLESRGAAKEQVQAVVSFGEEDPVCDQNDADCWAQNRRTAVRATCHL